MGRGIGPALEAHDVLSVLRNVPDAPLDLRERSLAIAGAVLDLLPGATAGEGRSRAGDLLQSGAALRKFEAICEAQGGFREPGRAGFATPYPAPLDGHVACIDNRRLARVAKLAGAPHDANAGVVCALRVGDAVVRGAPLFSVHAESRGELAYALSYARAHPDILGIQAD